MARRSKRHRPSSPAEILARNALQRGQSAASARRVKATPTLWGISEAITLQPANEDLAVTRDPTRKSRILQARRSNAFSLVNLSGDQERAAERYVRTWMERIGVQVDDHPPAPYVDRSVGLAPGQCVNQRMIDAGRRIEAVHRLVGPACARLLQALIDPIVKGEVRAWRVLVLLATGEGDRTAQGTLVKFACQNLHEAWPAVDEAEKPMMEERREKTKRGDLLEAERVRRSAPYAGGGTAA